MKNLNYSFVLALIFSLAIFFNGCATNKSEETIEPDLDTAIRNSAKVINDSLAQGTKIAVISFSSTSAALSEYIIEELSLALTGGKKLVVVDRRELDLIRNELKFQLTGEVDDGTISRIGSILGAQFIITGSLVDTGIYYRLRANAVNVENAVKEAPVSLAINKSDKQISYFLNSGSLQNSVSPKKDDSPAINPLLGYWVWEDEALTFLFLPDNKLQIFEDGEELGSGTYDDKNFYCPDLPDIEQELSYEFNGERVIIDYDGEDYPLYKADSPYRAPDAGMDLDAAMKDFASQMEARIPRETKIDIVSVSSSSERLSEYIISRLYAALIRSGKFAVNSGDLIKVRAEQGVQLSSEVDDESAMSIGRLRGAGVIVTGAFTNLGDVYSLTLSATNVETAARLAMYSAEIAKSETIEALLAR